MTERDNLDVFASDWDSLTDDDRPLQDSELDKIQAAYYTLVSKLVTDDGLAILLFQKRCITHMQKEHILQYNCTGSERTKRLLEIMQRGSFLHYCTFIKCLHETGQQHIAAALQPEGTCNSYLPISRD